MKKLFLLLIIGAVTIVTGCATTAIHVNRGFDIDREYKRIYKPDIGVVNTARVGRSMITAYKTRDVTTLVLDKDITEYYRYNGFTNSKTIAKGVLGLVRENSEGRFFAAMKGVHIEGPSGLSYSLNGGIFVYYGNYKPAEMYFENKYDSHVYTEILPLFDYKIIKKEELIPEDFFIIVYGKNDLKRELVYTGISGHTVLILYREYVDILARPSFTQELRYDLWNSRIIGFQNAKFEIIKADNASIKYRTLSHLEEE